MRIIHITRSLILNSGVSVFIGEIARAQAEAGHDVRVWCEWYPNYPTGGAKCEVRENLPGEIGADIVHIEALWDVYCPKAMRQCIKQGIPFVVSPHGGLMPRVFTKGRIKKFLFWHLFLKPIMKKAAAIHCTSEAEKAACERLGLKGPFVVAPLGVYMPERKVKVKGEGEQRTVLFLGRLGEEKGLENLLDAWKSVDHAGWVLKIAGPDWRGYKKLLDDKIAAENIEGVEFPGNADVALKDRLYREADVFVLSSPMENFSMVVLEALAYGVPAIATKGTPWSELETRHCGWWIDQGVEPLKRALMKAISLTDDVRAALGENGRRLAERKYHWSIIADYLVNCYKRATNDI